MDSHRPLEEVHREERDRINMQSCPIHLGDVGPISVKVRTFAITADLPERYALLYLRRGAGGKPNRFGWSGTSNSTYVLNFLPSCGDCYASLLAGTGGGVCGGVCACWDFSRLKCEVPADFPTSELPDQDGPNVMKPVRVTEEGVLVKVAQKAFDKLVAGVWTDEEAASYLSHLGGLTKGAVDHILEHADNERLYQKVTTDESKDNEDTAATFRKMKVEQPEIFEPWMCPLWDRAHLFVDPIMHLLYHVRREETGRRRE